MLSLVLVVFLFCLSVFPCSTSSYIGRNLDIYGFMTSKLIANSKAPGTAASVAASFPASNIHITFWYILVIYIYIYIHVCVYVYIYIYIYIITLPTLSGAFRSTPLALPFFM